MGFFDFIEDIGGDIADFFSDFGGQIEAEASRFGDRMGWNQSKSHSSGPQQSPGDLSTQLTQGGYGIDPRTGLQYGPSAMPSAELAPELQAQADRANLLLRQQRMRDATRMQMGALGLMQSYRPGGGAALEAGVYDRAAASIRQEAAAFTPPDLMFPYREAKASEARSDAKKQANRELLTNAAIGGYSAASDFMSGALGAQVEPESGAGGAAPPQRQHQVLPAQPVAQQQQQQQQQGQQGSMQPLPAQAQGPQPTYTAGSDGNFAVGAFATAAAQGYMNAAQQIGMSTVMNTMLSQMISADPFYPAFGQAVNNLLQS